MLEIVLAMIGVTTILVVCFAGQNPLVRFEKGEPAINPETRQRTKRLAPPMARTWC